MQQSQQDYLQPNQPVWIHKNNKFSKGIIVSITKEIIGCKNQQGQMVQSKKQNIYQRNIFEQSYDQNRYDLMDIDMINQPQILQSIKKRFEHNRIYSFVQSTLLAVNPYQYFNDLYTDQVKEKYYQSIIQKQGTLKDVLLLEIQNQPHVYAITAKMLSDFLVSGRSQAMVISGESGAGKTQANKQCLRFINFYYQQIDKELHDSQAVAEQFRVEKAIEISNPILEAFGNSKTIRNNNSSRFGKYLSIAVSAQTHKIKHAHFYNYLLQKSRIISRSKNQQNFHIFYQFVSKLPLQHKLKYFLLDQNSKQLTFDHFNYLKNHDGTKIQYHSHPDVTFEKVTESLQFLKDPDSQDFLCRILAAVLHLGNLEPYLDQRQDDQFCQVVPTKLFNQISHLLSVDSKQFASALTSYHIKVGTQVMTKYFGTREVQELIHSLAKCLYEKLFQWIIHQLNVLSSSEQSQDKKEPQQTVSLGFLDIYGFEVLETNSLEQLFINYTNERLHQIYLHKIFKQEKQIFEQEGLIDQYREIQFSDNLKIIELIDYDSLSIFNLLDEWCSVASPDESSFITKLRYNHKKQEYFPPSNFNLPSTLFRIKHTPKQIDYSVMGFRQKNKDLLRNQIKNVMKNSKNRILCRIFTDEQDRPQRNQRFSFSGNPQKKQSQPPKKFLSIKYRKQMINLMNDLGKSELHFIRCIKSNNQKKAMMMEDDVLFNQICYLGILDTIKIKKMGHCIKLTYDTLDKRFQWLLRINFEKPSSPKQIKNSISNFVPRFKNGEILFGKEKVFFKALAYSVMMKKYNSFYQDLKTKCHKLISLFVKNIYLKKRERKRRVIAKVEKYIKPILLSKLHCRKIQLIKDVQWAVRQFIRHRRVQNRIQNIRIVQAYIKRSLETRKRLKTLQAVQKVTKVMRKAVFRRKIQGRLVVNKLVEDFLHDAIILTGLNKIIKIENYVQTLRIQLSMAGELAMAELNAYHILEQKKFNLIEQYIQGFNSVRTYNKVQYKIVKAQALMRGWLVRRNYLRLRRSAVTIQRGWREYIFKKKGSNDMFKETYKYYFEKIANQNNSITSYLYNSSEDQEEDTIQQEYKQYIAKFKQKYSILYFIVDFQTFVDLDICYPYNSWPLNYFRVIKDGFLKDNPIQTLQVGQMCTIATSTNKLYLWGMNLQFNTLDNYTQIKPKNQIETVKLTHDNQLQITYEQDKDKNPSTQIPQYSTIKRKFILDAGKVTEILPNLNSKILKFPSNQRISQIACGSSHVIFLSSTKKVFTMGNGKKGQLGHGSLASEDRPKVVKFFDSLKTFHPIQISASFNSSIILFNHKKIIWFGTNGSISNQLVPTILDLKEKCNLLNNSQEFVPIKIQSSWSSSMSVIALSLVSFNGRMSNNLSLRNKTVDVLIQKWHESGIEKINPPYIPTISDHLEECHVKLPKIKIRIEPQSKRILKEMQDKIKNYKTMQQNMSEFSFCQTNQQAESKVSKSKK